jgi:hypothetical protein
MGYITFMHCAMLIDFVLLHGFKKNNYIVSQLKYYPFKVLILYSSKKLKENIEFKKQNIVRFLDFF